MRLSPPSDPYLWPQSPAVHLYISLLARVIKYTFTFSTAPPFHFRPNSLPLSNSLIIHRLAFLLLSVFYSIVFLYFMLNPNHLPLITSFHYSPLWLLLFLLFTFWNRIFVFVIYGFPSLFSCSWNCLLNLIPSVNRHDDSYAGLFFWIIMINIMLLFLYSEFLHLFGWFPLWIFIFSVRPCAFLEFLFLFLNI